ncbi:MAG: GNAT family N-acetyltransferase, partial [Acidimicrobiales bacterium]
DDVLADVQPRLLADPIANNVALAMLDQARRSGEQAGAVWSETPDGQIDLAAIGVARSGLHRHRPRPLALVAGDHVSTADFATLAGVVAERFEPKGIIVPIRAATELAAALVSGTDGVAVRVSEVTRFYHLRVEALRAPAEPAPGRLRAARADDLDLLEAFGIGFQQDAFGADASDGSIDVVGLRALFAAKTADDCVWLWDHPTDGPVSMTAATVPVGRVARIQGVYTPPERRRAGYAAACVAAQVNELADRGVEGCVLFADLANPWSNALYRRLGFEPRQVTANVALEASSEER